MSKLLRPRRLSPTRSLYLTSARARLRSRAVVLEQLLQSKRSRPFPRPRRHAKRLPPRRLRLQGLLHRHRLRRDLRQRRLMQRLRLSHRRLSLRRSRPGSSHRHRHGHGLSFPVRHGHALSRLELRFNRRVRSHLRRPAPDQVSPVLVAMIAAARQATIAGAAARRESAGR